MLVYQGTDVRRCTTKVLPVGRKPFLLVTISRPYGTLVPGCYQPANRIGRATEGGVYSPIDVAFETSYKPPTSVGGS